MLALAATAARAADPREAARAHYARGLSLAAQNGYEAALREFNEAYATSPQFAVLYNIAQAHVALGHPLEAIAALTKYLHDGQDRLPPGRREQVQTQIASLVATLDVRPAREASASERSAGDEDTAVIDPLRPAVAETARSARPTTTLAVRCAEPGVKIALDGKLVDIPSAARGLPVSGGMHRLSLTSAGRRPAEQTFEVAPGSSALVLCQFLSPLPPGAEPRVSFDGPPVFSGATVTPPASPQAVEVRRSTVGLALGGVGLALEGAALGLYLWNRGQVDQANNDRAYIDQHPNLEDRFERIVAYNERADSIHRATQFTIGLVVAGGAALAGGFYLWRTGRAPSRPAERPLPVDGGVTVGLGPGAGGVSWSGSW